MKNLVKEIREINPNLSVAEIKEILKENLRFGISYKYSFAVKNEWVLNKVAVKIYKKLRDEKN